MARASAHVEQYADRLVAELAQDDRIDLGRRRDARCGWQLIGRPAGALANHLLHTLAVTAQHVVVFANHREELLNGAALGPGRGRAVVDPVLLANATQQPGIAQELEMA